MVAHCRAGFEPECAAELLAGARALGIAASAPVVPGAAWVALAAPGADPHASLESRLRLPDLVFARQIFSRARALDDLPARDRVGPLVAAARAVGPSFGDLVVEVPDSAAGRELSTLARKLTVPLRRALRDEGLVSGEVGGARLHVMLRDGRSAFVGRSDPAVASPWSSGIPRLRFPRGAPSRSALKLEEALLTFLSPDELRAAMQPGMRGVDLGASPGGWSWVLAARGLRVTAVDNGPLDRRVLEAGAVEHHRTDGFRFRPRRSVDWLTCDIADKPARVARLIADWLAGGLTRHAVFNLKLPMRRRYETVLGCRGIIESALAGGGARWSLRFRHLYHDREEVTGFARRC